MGNTYNLWWDDVAPPVADDNYEENDGYATAYDLSSYENTWLNTIDGYGIQWDDDWYEILITTGYERLLVDLQFSHAAGDIDIEVYASDGTTYVTGSSSSTDNEYIDYVLPSSGTYYLRIYYGDNGNSYDLWWDDIIPVTDDNYEENDADTTAYDLTSYEDTWLSTIDGYGVQLDYDWYEIYVDSGFEEVVVDVIFTHASGDIDVGLIDSALSLVAASTSTTDNEYIDVIVPSSGTYYIYIEGDNTGNTYDLLWDDLTPIVGDDNYEPNDLPVSAYDLSAHEGVWLSTIDGMGIQFDYDCYEIWVPSGNERVIVECTFTHASGDVDIQLWNTTGGITASFTTTDDEYIDYTVLSAGVHYIIVYGDDLGNSYDLRWQALEPVADDAYEENDGAIGAYDLTSHPDTWLTDISGPGIQSDVDFFKISVSTPDQRIIIDLTYTYAEGPLILTLTNNLLTPLATSNTAADNEHIDMTLPGTGTFYIKVDGGDAGNSYDLKYSLSTGGGTKPPIPGYNLLFVIAVVFGISIILISRIRKLTRK